MSGVVTLKKKQNIFSTGSIPRPRAITMSSEDVLPTGNEKGSYVIGRLFLKTPDDQSLTGTPGTLSKTVVVCFACS